jgi:hypothetical protein
MTTELANRPDDMLEERLRTACRAVIPHLLDSTPVASTDHWDDSELEHPVADVRGESEAALDGRSRRLFVAAAAVLVLVTVSAVWAVQRRSIEGVGETPATSPSSVATAPPSPTSTSTVSSVSGAVTGDSSALCDDSGCTGFDRLPVVPGATDFYTGPAELGSAQTTLQWFDTTTRCTELTSDYTACQRIEGLAGVNLVSYPSEPSSDATATSVGSESSSLTINIGTTFTDITPSEYATQWGMTGAGPGLQQAATVRGHAAVRYGEMPAVVWQEQPGVLVWVDVPPEDQDRLLAIAEGVRRTTGPTTILDRVMITPLAQPWQAQDNDGIGVIAATSGGVDCVGLDYIDTCGQDIHERTIVRPRSDGTTAVAGSAPPDASAVRIDLVNGEPIVIETIAFANYRQRFFLTRIAAGQVQTVTWLNNAGTELATEHPATTPPDAEPEPTAVPTSL